MILLQALYMMKHGYTSHIFAARNVTVRGSAEDYIRHEYGWTRWLLDLQTSYTAMILSATANGLQRQCGRWKKNTLK
jgi:hypothetical protein